MTGMSQLTAKVNESNAEQLGTDMFETTAHGGARPEHQEWQGRWYTKDELESICGLGEVTGLCGANCYHDYYPVVPGISEPTYTAEQIEEFNRKENEPVEYNGKKYTKYEATQRQRKLETTMRAQRQEIKLLKEGGASEDDLIVARSRYRGTSAEYARFSKAMDLPQQRERVTVDGLGNIGQGKYTQPDNINNKSVDKTAESGIIILKDSEPKLFKVTDASLSSIPKVMAFDDEKINRSVEEHCKAILESVKDDKVGTECTVSIRNSDLYSETRKGGSGDGTVRPIIFEQPFISIHNHASNETISPRDARMLSIHDNCYAVVVIGNKGDKIYIIQKTESFDSDGLMRAISEKIKPENSNVTNADFLRGCEKYGTKYFE